MIGLLFLIEEINKFFVLYGFEGIIIFRFGDWVKIFFKLFVCNLGVCMLLLNGLWIVIGVVLVLFEWKWVCVICLVIVLNILNMKFKNCIFIIGWNFLIVRFIVKLLIFDLVKGVLNILFLLNFFCSFLVIWKILLLILMFLLKIKIFWLFLSLVLSVLLIVWIIVICVMVYFDFFFL